MGAQKHSKSKTELKWLIENFSKQKTGSVNRIGKIFFGSRFVYDLGRLKIQLTVIN